MNYAFQRETHLTEQNLQISYKYRAMFTSRVCKVDRTNLYNKPITYNEVHDITVKAISNELWGQEFFINCYTSFLLNKNESAEFHKNNRFS